MKKIFCFIFMILIMPMSVSASNEIYDIDIDIYLNQDGSANIRETWDVDGEDGTEWYKVMNNLRESELSNFSVSMDGMTLKQKTWDVDESLYQKRGYYGINYTNEGLELCFGKYDYERHTFVLNYNLSNFVFNTDDSQVLYFNLIDRLSDVNFSNFSVTISSYYRFPETLDVWGYGYEGYAYVSDGKIEMTNKDSNMNNDYVVLLAKFPTNTFTNTFYRIPEYKTFDDVLTRAEKGADVEDSFVIFVIILTYLFQFLMEAIIIIPIILVVIICLKNGYGYIGNKKIRIKEVPLFREIPCNKDIYYANALIKLNKFNYKESNILGAIILKWVRSNKISFRSKEVGIFNKETSVIDLTMNPIFDNDLETRLFYMMYEASKDGILETKEFEKWARYNHSNFLKLFREIENQTIEELKYKGHIYKRTTKKECKKKNVMDDVIYNDSVRLCGLKKYLIEFSSMDSKEVMDVKLWDEYLMFAYLFGIADKVAAQLNKMYPEIIEQMESSNFNFDTVKFVSDISTRSVSAANSYSSGGGGSSSSGGGGGSSGGGGGGSR